MTITYNGQTPSEFVTKFLSNFKSACKRNGLKFDNYGLKNFYLGAIKNFECSMNLAHSNNDKQFFEQCALIALKKAEFYHNKIQGF